MANTKKIHLRKRNQSTNHATDIGRCGSGWLGWTSWLTEVEALIVRWGLVENIEFNEQRFRQLLTKDPTMAAIMRIIRSLLEWDDKYQLSASIFKIEWQGWLAPSHHCKCLLEDHTGQIAPLTHDRRNDRTRSNTTWHLYTAALCSLL
jgi:hypothetical protein